MRVGYIGLGAMGGALARHLVGKFDLTVLDLNRAAVTEFEKLGARGASTPADVARNSEVVLLCLPRSSDVGKVLFGPAGLAEAATPGTIVIDQTSGIPGETRGFARQLAERGVTMFDAPVSGAMATAIAGTISIIASGPRDAFESAVGVLKTISPNVFHCGDRVGNGQAVKALNNMMNSACRFATLEAVAMGRKYGVPLEALTEALNHTTGRNYTTQVMLPNIAQGRPSTKFALALQVKDMNQAIVLGMEHDVPLPIAMITRGLLQIGLNTLGESAQLEQMIGVIEAMASARIGPCALVTEPH